MTKSNPIKSVCASGLLRKFSQQADEMLAKLSNVSLSTGSTFSLRVEDRASSAEGSRSLYKPTSVLQSSVQGWITTLPPFCGSFFCELWCTLKNPTQVICGYDYWTGRATGALKIPTR